MLSGANLIPSWMPNSFPMPNSGSAASAMSSLTSLFSNISFKPDLGTLRGKASVSLITVGTGMAMWGTYLLFQHYIKPTPPTSRQQLEALYAKGDDDSMYQVALIEAKAFGHVGVVDDILLPLVKKGHADSMFLFAERKMRYVKPESFKAGRASHDYPLTYLTSAHTLYKKLENHPTYGPVVRPLLAEILNNPVYAFALAHEYRKNESTLDQAIELYATLAGHEFYGPQANYFRSVVEGLKKHPEGINTESLKKQFHWTSEYCLQKSLAADIAFSLQDRTAADFFHQIEVDHMEYIGKDVYMADVYFDHAKPLQGEPRYNLLIRALTHGSQRAMKELWDHLKKNQDRTMIYNALVSVETTNHLTRILIEACELNNWK